MSTDTREHLPVFPAGETAADYLATAVEAARAAGCHAREQRARAGDVHEHFRHDVKLKLDLECQAIALGRIHARYPHHAVLAEEDAACVGAQAASLGAAYVAPAFAPRPGAQTPEWVVDPIDGTVNFFHGLPFWCCSVAVRIAGRSVAGVVFAPEGDELYTATCEGPALLNGAPIRTSSTAELGRALMLTGLSQKSEEEATRVEVIARLTEAVQKVRVLGAAALDMCRVARGQADAYWEPAIHIWDMAAASLIVERAGGRGSVLATAGTRVNFVATNAPLHDAVVALIRAETSRRA